MLDKKLKRLRLARGLSLDALAAELGGIVTKQALSKYETGKAKPSPIVLSKLAEVLGVKAARLWQDPTIDVEFPGYRKKSRLPKKERDRLESLIAEEMEQRVRLQELIGEPSFDLPIQAFRVRTLEDVELAATALRGQWDLGLDPISSIIETLESHGIHVVEVDAPEAFDGISAIARDEGGRIVAAGAITRRYLARERQRFNLAHELGHLVLKIVPGLDEEAAAHRFAGAFLAPASVVRREIGARRSLVQLEELKYMRGRYGLSMQAAVRRLRDLEVINEALYKGWCISFSKWGWRKKEPGESAPEKPRWLRRAVLRAVSEGAISAAEAESIGGQHIDEHAPLSLIEKRAFMKLSLAERRRILEGQAETIADEYEELTDIQGGDIIEDY